MFVSSKLPCYETLTFFDHYLLAIDSDGAGAILNIERRLPWAAATAGYAGSVCQQIALAG